MEEKGQRESTVTVIDSSVAVVTRTSKEMGRVQINVMNNTNTYFIF